MCRPEAAAVGIMRSLVMLSVVVGVALGQGYIPDTPEVLAARNAFVKEYNRLAMLAAQAPDTHIYHEQLHHHPGATKHHHHHYGVPLPSLQQHAAVNAYKYSANLGLNEHYVPGPKTFSSVNHLAGHMAGHQAFTAQDAPVVPWTGPLADTVPAGLNGQVKDTPGVAAAKDEHFKALKMATHTPTGHTPYTHTFHPPASHSFQHIPAPAQALFPAPAQALFPAPAPVKPWTGPMADTVPAGVDGFVRDTPGVANAKAAHYQALASALGYQGVNFAV
ncbi:Cuticle protein [Homarus americanus]|uniref:Cuticle protein n=1 Tax=Homarus americanus TaxID=6706 RepID=A0A8J5K0Q3_HOMAM|nr:Cuticle protein [Homarus americanus]